VRPLRARHRAPAAGGREGVVLRPERVAELFARHHGELYRYAARFTGDPDLAEDVVQECFVRLVEREVTDDGQVRAWLFTVATRVAIDMQRVQKRRADILARTREEWWPEASDAEEDVERADLAERVRAALRRLSERERAVLLMREEGFKHHEIAAAVGTTTKSVGSMIARALDHLARRLELDVEAVR
jgi:RNA polymerase sigma-70 factor (ECF subfamily)